MSRCRTAALGGHKDKCVNCQFEAPISYNSCRSRCCPKCQARARRRWLEAQQRDLLNTNYFHVVFTLPHELNPLALTTPKLFFDLLFSASSQTLLGVAADPKRLGAEIGFLSILHTWSQNLLSHYHVHSVVPAGGLSPDHQRWIPTSHPLFLVPIPTLRTVFREKFLAGLRQLFRKDMLDLTGPAAAFRDHASFEQLMEKLGKRTGSSMPSLACKLPTCKVADRYVGGQHERGEQQRACACHRPQHPGNDKQSNNQHRAIQRKPDHTEAKNFRRQNRQRARKQKERWRILVDVDVEQSDGSPLPRSGWIRVREGIQFPSIYIGHSCH